MPEALSLYSICSDLGVTPRQIERWIESGAMPGPGGSRRYPVYTTEHLRLAREIRDTLTGENGPRTLAQFADRRQSAVPDHL